MNSTVAWSYKLLEPDEQRAFRCFGALPGLFPIDAAAAVLGGGAGASGNDDAMEGLIRYCATEASLAAEGLVGHVQVDWLDRASEDPESYRAARAWLIERGRTTEASDIAWALLFFWVIPGHGAEGLRWYEPILDQSPLLPSAESRALLGATVMWCTQGELERARTGLTRALALALGAGDMDMVAQAVCSRHPGGAAREPRSRNRVCA